MKIKYIDDDMRYGIDYDWDLIKKEFKKLNIPKEVYNPYNFHEVVGGKYIFDLSERDTGKTTNWLLLAMVVNKLYGSEIVYMREIIDMISPRNDTELFKTILAYGYVEKLTDGKYNNIRSRSRRYYYWNSETGEEATEPFMLKWSLDENAMKKSSVQLPDSDIIIFDEVISKHNYLDEFVVFMDSIKTIIRSRFCPLIILLANTIDIQSFWFKEFEIYDDIQGMEPGDCRVVTSSGGSIVDVAMIGKNVNQMSDKKILHNKTFFAFKNPKLNSIRGGAWAVNVYQHPYREKDTTSVINNRYISHNNHLLNIEIMYNEKHGYYVVVHPANEIYDDSIVYTLEKQLPDRRYKFRWGTSKIDKKIMDLYNHGKWTYVSNTEGSLIDDYMRNIKLI